MSNPKVIIFDVNETLLDLKPLRTSVGTVLKGQEDLLPLWFSTMLHYSLVKTLVGDYHDFGEIGTAALMMVAQQQGLDLEHSTAQQAIVGSITNLPPHPDVKEGLAALSQSGFRLISLTNSLNKGVATQFQNAGLTDYFERRFSMEDVRTYKPDPRLYRWALKEIGVQPEEALMVAAHTWDLAGAKAVGLQTAFIQRPGTTLYPNTTPPDSVVADLNQLAQQLISQQ